MKYARYIRYLTTMVSIVQDKGFLVFHKEVLNYMLHFDIEKWSKVWIYILCFPK